MTAQAIIPVPFRNTSLIMLDNNGQPYVAMRQVVEGMGLDWSAQAAKFRANSARWGVAIITTPSKSGDQSTVCLPLRKLPGWLMTIQPGRVRPELRETIIAFQNECDDVLWEHWQARNPEPATLKAYSGCLTLEQQDTVKALVKSRVEACPKDKQAKAAITCWSAIKSKYGVGYKEVPAEHFAAVLSLIARLDLDDCRHAATKALNDYFGKCDAAIKSAGLPYPAFADGITDEMVEGLVLQRLARSRLLLTIGDTGTLHMKAIPEQASVIDVANDSSLECFMREVVPTEKLPVVMQAISSRMTGIVRHRLFAG